jgi:Short C-terminal domain
MARRTRPSLLGQVARTAGRTAVIAGTATAVSGKVAARQAGGAAPPAGTPYPAGLTKEAMEQLQKLAELHKSGILTDEEFATQKARILG